MNNSIFFLCISIVFISFVCKSKQSNIDILNGLNKSYILNKELKNNEVFFEEYKVNYETFVRDSIDYYNSLNRLITSDTKTIKYLLSFEKDNQACQWIKTKEPYSSNIKPEDFLKKSIAAKILIDNYILNREKIVVEQYVYKIDYSWLKIWYKEGLSREALKEEYLAYIQTL